MPLLTTTYSDLIAHLSELGVTPGMDILVQSQLTSFGLVEGGPKTVYRAIRDVLGEAGTLAVPAYRLRSQDAIPFDKHVSPSVDVGVFSEYVRNLPGAVRSNCQIHSHAAVGPKAGIFDLVSGSVSLGPGSDFEAMHQGGFQLLLLGCDFRVATFAIHVEAIHGHIPYRAWRDLPRPRVGQHGESIPDTCRYYARVRQGANEDLDIIGNRIRSQVKVTFARCAYGASLLLSLADFQSVAMDMLLEDPEVLIKGDSK